MEVLDELSPGVREQVEALIENEIEASVEEEREAIVEYIRSRIGFWNSNSNVNKKIKRLADDVEDEVHHRIQQDNGQQDS